jgi:hypothetical protein
MYTVIYYKIGNRWYLDFPEYIEKGGEAEDLERVGAFHDFLEMASKGEETICFHMDTKLFEGADVFELTGSTGEKTGGYYQISSYQGKAVDYELWFNTVIYSDQKELPQTIYLKKIAL